ncbi:5-(carboxyamino)imidazole ribonucleotide synthase [Candidatus Micrarchaeota archaeon]|nr:5-(carboxyamino)imidazole ribonucleotide synthase [Candidatus Micrarchaeota archaeon]
MKSFLPGSTIGILGGGQLGRMLAQAAKPMGYKVLTLDPSENSPCGQVADLQIVAKFSDLIAAKEFSQKCEVATIEFENVDAKAVELIEKQGILVRPSSKVLHVTQNRLRQKEFLRGIGIGTANFRKIGKEGRRSNSKDATKIELQFPAILKTASLGYDGKGQWIIANGKEVQKIVLKNQGVEFILEEKVDFQKEISIVGARGVDGKIVVYPVSENVHKNGILDTTIVPAGISRKIEIEAQKIIKKIAVKFDYVGVLCVEMFLLQNGKLLVNEIAPRTHNSGHYSIDACKVSQFEQQVRAVCGIKLEKPQLQSACCMANILGDGSGNVLKGTEKLLLEKNVYLHLYGKTDAKKNRKMGHFTVLAKTPKLAFEKAQKLRKYLKWAKK